MEINKRPSSMRNSQRLSAVLGGLMAIQSATGIVWPEAYRDAAWITAAWFGNDWFTLVVIVPVLGIGLVASRRGSLRGTLLWLGVLAYALYNYAFYLLGAALNAFFPFYAGCVVLSATTLIMALHPLDASAVASGAARGSGLRTLGAYLVFMGCGLGAVWSSMWVAHVVAGHALPVAEPVFRLVAALDMVLMVPALVVGGTLLWRGRAWGFVIAPIAAIQGALYLSVLSTNAVVLARRGLGALPGELVIWAPLALATTAAAVALLIRAGSDNSYQSP